MRNKRYLIPAILILAVLIIGLVVDVVVLPQNVLTELYRNPTTELINHDNYAVIKKAGFSYEIQSRNYGLTKQQFTIIYTTDSPYLGAKQAAIADTVTVEQTGLFSWKTTGYLTSFIQTDGSTNEDLTKAKSDLKNNLAQNDFSSKSTDNEAAITLPNNGVTSPDGRLTAKYRSLGDIPQLYLSDQSQSIDNNVYHFQWATDSSSIYYAKSEDGKSELVNYLISTNQRKNLLSIASPSVGFEVFSDQTILYTSTSEVGIITNTGDHKVILAFTPPISNSDEPYVPNIIIDEDKQAATVGIPDKDFLNNKQMRYLKISYTGMILSDKNITEE